MTPKEKADELISKYHTSRDADDFNDVRDVFAARRCALIAVDEIIRHTYMGKAKSKNDDSSFEYWKEVKQEIQNL